VIQRLYAIKCGSWLAGTLELPAYTNSLTQRSSPSSGNHTGHLPLTANTSFRCFIEDGKQCVHEAFYHINPDGTPCYPDAALQNPPAAQSHKYHPPTV